MAAYLGHARHAANQQHLLHVRRRNTRILHTVQARLLCSVQQTLNEVLVLRARDGHEQVLGPRGVGCDEGKVDLGGSRRGELALGLLGGFAQALYGEAVGRQVDALLLLERLRTRSETIRASRCYNKECLSSTGDS